MDERMIRFISALRASGVRISLAESADAFQAVDKIGVQDREQFRLSLRATLVKDAGCLPVFDELFPLFFDSADPHTQTFDVTQEMTPEEAQMLAQLLRQFGEQLRQMLEKLLRGEQLSQQELDQLAQITGLNRAQDMRYRDWYAQRMMRALRFKEVQEALREIMELLAKMGMNKQRLEQMRQLIQANQKALEEQISRFAGQKIAENMSEAEPDEANLDELMDRPFRALSDREMDILRREVRRLANRLRSRIALRQKRAKTGQLDAKATLRANLKNAGVPMEIKHRDHRLKPKLVVICDISTSMRHCSELMLSLVYALQDLITKTHAFAFIDHLEYISPDFTAKEANEAIAGVLQRMPPGYYSTDLGFALKQFAGHYLDTVDQRTTFIMVGDGRNNYNDPALDIFQMLARRARRMIWINPEPPMLWGTGDSDMLQYAPFCTNVLMAATLGELTEAVDHLLSHP
ncbi:MAG: VWA domain-containing protein [Caldilinea sp.]|nr:VWA domain-containing protein [Caldilinea sp.]MDW8439760.1 VWA domain-containing protein [Caldilineaceae bacterium]